MPSAEVWAGSWDWMWRITFRLMRLIARSRGRRCGACGGYLRRVDADPQRRYCDATCKRRQQRRRERHVAVLRETGEPCPMCGGWPTAAKVEDRW